MQTTKPEFFDQVRAAAENRWNQLEADPELAGPWHQLFKQVQSPRHVLSELLQNADDAGATETKAWIQDRTFFFEHNGDDFSHENFLSLCRFGYSNKRSLHTIGFRGVGFKSTFSLGPQVSVVTPTLSFSFDRLRFTQPHWKDTQLADGRKTIISVEIEDEYRMIELQKNLNEWQASPVSLLFFRNIKCLFINGIELRWILQGNGFCLGSQVLRLVGDDSKPYHLIRSEPEDFPAEAIDEIRQERLVGDDSDFMLPPCQVEIVVGGSPGLYVVLPTAVKPNIPFACNAPFMQDPARVKIKDPETSPTNRWLLDRVGKLAATAMHRWLANEAVQLPERAEAYHLWITTSNTQRGTDAACSEVIVDAFHAGIKDLPVALSQQGTLELKNSCVSLEKQLQHIWPADVFTSKIEPTKRKPLCEYIHHDAVLALCSSGYAERITRSRFCLLLDELNPPKPELDCLLRLWVYLYPEVVGYRGPKTLQELPIVPVEGRDALFASKDVSRLGEWHNRLSEDSKQLVSHHLICISDEWLDFLDCAENDYVAEKGRWASQTAIEMADRMLRDMGLSDGTDTKLVASKMAKHIRKTESHSDSSLIRLAHLCSETDCAVPASFPYQVSDSSIRLVSDGVCILWGYNKKNLYPDTIPLKYCIADTYGSGLNDKLQQRWIKWSSSSLSGLLHLPPLREKEKYFSTALQLSQYIQSNYGVAIDLDKLPYAWQTAYSSQYYRLIDYDIQEDVLAHWSSTDSIDDSLREVMEQILDGSIDEWLKSASLKLFQTTTNGRTEAQVSHQPIAASWLRRFQQCPCVLDSRGNYSLPSHLLRRTLETMPFIDVERFVDERLDTKFNSKILQALGVSGQQPGPELILKLLIALANYSKPAFADAQRLYEQLDKAFVHASDIQKEAIVQAFHESPIILTDQGSWLRASEVFVSTDGLAIDGIQTVMEPVRNLSLWRLLEISERIDEGTAVNVISSYQRDSPLAAASVDVVRALLRRFPEAILHSCGVWISLNGTLKNLSDCKYCVLSADFDPTTIYDSVRDVSLNLAFLDSTSKAFVSESVCLPRLEAILSFQPELAEEEVEPQADVPKWLRALGACLGRVILDDALVQDDLHELASRLCQSRIAFATKINVIPFLDGSPAGLPVEKDGAFVDTRIFVKKLSASRLASLIPSVIAEFLPGQALKSAICYCYDRSSKSIADYFEANFSLEHRRDSGSPNDDDKKSHVTSESSQVDEEQSKHNSLNPKAVNPATVRAYDEEIGSDDLIGQPAGLLNSAQASQSDSSLSESDRTLGGASGSPMPHGLAGDATESSFSQDNPNVQAPTSGAKAAHLDLIERFAAGLGLKSNSQAGVYYGESGRALSKHNAESFPWVLKEAYSTVVHQYLCSPESIFTTAFEISHEALGLMREFPDFYSIISVDACNEVVVVRGSELDSRIKAGDIKVFPSTYRLVPQ